MLKRKMPSKETVKIHWQEPMVNSGKFDSLSEFHEDDYCFACGMKAHTQRAHILPKNRGGSDDASNIHLLCEVCHKQSEFISGADYDRWLRGQSAISMALGIYAYNGLGAQELLSRI